MINKIKNDIKQAMKDKDKTKLSTLRMLLTTLEREKISLKLSDVSELNDEQILKCINQNAKALNQEIDALKNACRDTSDQEEQKRILKTYLPEQLDEDEDELYEIVKEVAKVTAESGQNIGFAIKTIVSMLGAKVDKSLASKLLKEEIKKMENDLSTRKE